MKAFGNMSCRSLDCVIIRHQCNEEIESVATWEGCHVVRFWPAALMAGGWAQETYRSVDSRMAQESLRRHVLRVLRVWRSWFIFSDDFLNGLQV